MTKLIKPNIKKVVNSYINDIKEKNIGIAFSGGIDSLSLVFSSMECNKNINLYSFTLEDHISTDFLEARKFAELYKLNFTPIFLPKNELTLKKDLLFLSKLGAKKKVDFTCGYPMLYIFRNLKEKTLVSGLGADGHYCISKKGMIHFKDRIQEFRDNLFSNPNYAQKILNENIAKYYKKTTVIPYLAKEMIDEFRGTTWVELNKPRQKNATLMNYQEYFKEIKVRNHVNLQLGDSKIESNLYQLLEGNWNIRNYKSITGIFNSINRGEVWVK